MVHLPLLGDDLRLQRVNDSPGIALCSGTRSGESFGASRSIIPDVSKAVRNNLRGGGKFPLLTEHMQ